MLVCVHIFVRSHMQCLLDHVGKFVCKCAKTVTFSHNPTPVWVQKNVCDVCGAENLAH